MNACIYSRFSDRPDAALCDSNAKQLERCTAYCTAYGHTITATFEDSGLSGGRADNRPGLQAAIDHACKERGILVCYDLSRLARSVRDAIAISEKLEKAGANLAFVVGSIDTSTPIGRAFFTITAAFAQLQREEIAARTKSGMRKHMDRGLCMGGIPYGYRRSGDRLEPDAGEMQVVATIQQLRKGRRTIRDIADQLNLDQTKARGAKWHRATVERILKRFGDPKA
jgi:site-specific DNA recombinase